MDVAELATGLGAAAALISALGSYAKAQRASATSVKYRDQIEQLQKDVAALLTKVEDLKRELDQTRTNNDQRFVRLEQQGDTDKLERRMDQRLQSMETRLGNCVTSEEFQTYAATTTQQVTGLTEKVGRATGILETFRR